MESDQWIEVCIIGSSLLGKEVSNPVSADEYNELINCDIAQNYSSILYESYIPLNEISQYFKADIFVQDISKSKIYSRFKGFTM